MSETFDYVVIGSGSAGSVLAGRLSEDADTRVCVLEAGPRDRNPFIHIPAGFMKTIVNPSINWLYQTEPGEGTAGRSITQPRGKTLGGSSSINGHVFNRGQRMDFDVWAQRGNRGWGYLDILPYFKRMERRIGPGEDQFRGRDGPFVVTDLDWPHPLCEAFIEGATELGIPRNPDYNAATQMGVSYSQRSVYQGRRMSTARAFLHPASKRGNLEVKTRAHAERIRFEGRRAVGVRYLQGGESKEIGATREVIVCGGTFNSPQLLQISGVGSDALLSEIGVPIVHDLPGVGENLRDHYGFRLTARVQGVETINERSRGWRLGVEVLKYLAFRRGIVNLHPTLVYLFWKSDESLDTSDIQMTFTPASYREGVQSQLEDQPGMSIASWQQRPESTGFVRARSADPFEAPVIQPRYLEHETDRRIAVRAIDLARRLLRSKALSRYFVREEYPGDHVQGNEALLEMARARGTTCFHPMGTCRMGPSSDPTAVVDDALRVHGLEGLRVVDASIMPTMPSANTNASTIMIAEKASDMIRGRTPLPTAVLKE